MCGRQGFWGEMGGGGEVRGDRGEAAQDRHGKGIVGGNPVRRGPLTGRAVNVKLMGRL